MDLQGEIWKDIPSFEGVYQISNFGRVKSFKLNSKGIILSNKNSKGDYLRMVLYKYAKKGYKKTVSLHRLVYQVFVGEIPNNYEVDHIDGNKQNNNVNNLQCLCRKDHSKKTITEKPRTVLAMNYRNLFMAKCVEQYSINGDYINTYHSAKDASLKTGVCKRNIHQVASKTEYKHGKIRKQAGGFIWKYKEEKV